MSPLRQYSYVVVSRRTGGINSAICSAVDAVKIGSLSGTKNGNDASRLYIPLVSTFSRPAYP